MNTPFSITVRELTEDGPEAIPPELLSTSHLIYSSPATLAFNSPGAQGFGVKRAGLAIPGSVMLLVSPACCGRNTSALGTEASLADRFFYLLLDDTDIVTGRHLTKIPQAVREVRDACKTPPSVVMICITCIDALLGTDMERVCRKCEEAAGLPVVPCYMYALTREGRLPPMASVRKSVYSLLKPRPKVPRAVNLLGYFSPIDSDSELFRVLRAFGLRQIRELSRCRTFEEYGEMASANFNLVLHPESRYAADEFQSRLHIPYIEIARLYQPEKIRTQYRLLAQTLQAELPELPEEDEARAAIDVFRRDCGPVAFAVGEWCNADPFELALALIRSGFQVPHIFGTVGPANFNLIRAIAADSPDTRVFSNLSPSMLFFTPEEYPVDAVIGRDAMYYHNDTPGIPWTDETQPFGFTAVTALFRSLRKALRK